jgi:hypothetical protein
MTIRLPEFTSASASAYQQELEKSLYTLTETALKQWQKDSNHRIEQALNDNLKLINRLVEDAISQLNEGFSASSGGSTPAGGGDSYASIGRSLGTLAGGLLSDLISGGKTTKVTSSETTRSQSIRSSRSQQQAELIRNAEKGNRNL